MYGFHEKVGVMTRTWSTGSEWRKWDLHLHAPGTKLNDQFEADDGDVWDQYCRRLQDSDVQAFGITDYFSADGYFSAREKFRARYPDSGKVFFPNIELRTNDVVNKEQEEINIHLVFNPFRPDHENKIQSFLLSLKTSKTDGVGRNVKASELTQKAHFEEATTTRAFIREAFEETYGKGAELLDRVLIITAANNDGIRPERGKKRKLLITDEVDKFSDGFFGNAGNVEYFLSSNRAEDKTEHTEPKPVLSGCDAHSLAQLDERLGQVVSDSSRGIVLEPTWIKADLTFEGIKQIIFEPQNRVFIGEEPEIERRVREHKTRYIESLHLTCVDGYRQDQHGAWFCDEKIVLGKELIAIIGNKGSGKSAVTDIIGLLGNSHNQTSKAMSGGKAEELFSFLNKDKFLKGGCAAHFQGALHWYEVEPDRKLLNAQVAPHLPEKVEYLPQKYLERICANIADDEFRVTLNEVIFRYVKPQDQFGKTNLDDLIKYRTQQAEEGIAQKNQELLRANENVVSVEKKLTEDYRKELEERIKLKKEDLEAHATTRPPEKQNPEATAGIASAETAQIEQLTRSIASLADQITQVETEQVEVSRSVEELRQVRQAIEREARALTGLEAKYQTMAASLVQQKTTLEAQKAEIVERLGKPLREYQQYISDLKLWTDRENELRGDDQNPGTDTLNGLEKELDNVTTLIRRRSVPPAPIVNASARRCSRRSAASRSSITRSSNPSTARLPSAGSILASMIFPSKRACGSAQRSLTSFLNLSTKAPLAVSADRRKDGSCCAGSAIP